VYFDDPVHDGAEPDEADKGVLTGNLKKPALVKNGCGPWMRV
jgi:hypothetical protein